MIIRYGTQLDPARTPLSKAVEVENLVWISGQLGRDDQGKIVDGGVYNQTRQVLSNIEKILRYAVCTVLDVAKTTCWLTDKAYFADFHRAYREFFGDLLPARSCIQSGLMIDALVEVETIAFLRAPPAPSTATHATLKKTPGSA